MKKLFFLLLATAIVASCSSVPENFVKVDGGTFMKGWTEKERELYKVNYGKDEDPLAPKEMSVETFYISKYEVTVGLWYEVMGYIPEKITYAEWSKEPDCPIMGITWLEAVKFCNRLSAKEGYKGCYDFGELDEYGRFGETTLKSDAEGYRLPTDVEWEYAARGGQKSKGYRFAGSDSLDEVAHWNAEVPSKVGMYKPNELGIYDMTGNAAEYTYGISPDVTIGKAFVTVQGGHYNGRLGGNKPQNFVIYKDDTSWGEGSDVGLRLVFQKKK